MKIAVLSDTHLSSPTPWFGDVYARYLAPADAVIHCGDIAGYAMLEYLEGLPNFHGVSGNMDEMRIQEELPPTRILELEGFRIGLTHGAGAWGDAASVVTSWFAPGLDLICFGHTHVYEWRLIDGTRVLNPGSAGLPRKGESSLALITAEKGLPLMVEKVVLERG